MLRIRPGRGAELHPFSTLQNWKAETYLRRFQVEQREAGVPTPTINSVVSALRFFFTYTLEGPTSRAAWSE